MLHIIYGNDQLAVKEAFARLRESLNTDGGLETNTTTLDARAATPQEVMGACNTVPFLGEGRLVVLEGLFSSMRPAAKGRSARGKKDAAPAVGPHADDEDLEAEPSAAEVRWEPLAEYIPQMPPSTTLVLLDRSVLATNPMLKALSVYGKVEKFELPGEKQVEVWVTARAKTIGLKIDAPAARLLAELIGPDPYVLASELEKLHAYSGGDVIREGEVRELVSRAKEHKGWDLTDAMLDGQGAKAARVLQELIEDGSHAGQLLATIATEYRKIMICKDMLERGARGSEIATRINAKPGYGLDKRIDKAERMSWEALRAAQQSLIQAELDQKEGLMEGDLALELAVQELAAAPVRTVVR